MKINNSGNSINISKDDKLALAASEIAMNKFFAVLLILATILYLLNIFTLPTIIIYTVFILFLRLGKKYHPLANIILLIIALGIYFISIPPVGWGLFRMLKEFRINGFIFNNGLIFFIAPLIFISLVIKNVLSNILAYFKTTTASRKIYYLISLFIILATLLAYPFFDSVRLRERTMNVQINGELSDVYTRQSLTFIDRYNMAGDFTSRFDTATKKYIYQLRLTEPLAKDIQITKVETDGEKINFINDSRAKCLNCQKDTNNTYGLIFPAGKDIDFIITSDQLIKIITFTEPGNKVAEFVFWK